MGLYTCGFIPIKSALVNGTIALAIRVEAKNEKIAEMKASLALEKSSPDSGGNYFKPRICVQSDDLEYPPIDQFDSGWNSQRIWNDEIKDFELIVTEECSVDEPGTLADLPADVQAFAEKWIATRPGEWETTERRTYDLLDRVIALALNGVKRPDAKASDVKNARALIIDRGQTWRMISASLRVIVDILDVDDETIFEPIT